jgi:hypothetical protein
VGLKDYPNINKIYWQYGWSDETGVTNPTGMYTVLCGKGKDSSYEKLEHIFNTFP